MIRTVQQVEIRQINERDCIESLTTLIHEAYASQASLGLRYWATHQSAEVTKKRFASGQGILAELEGDYVGTITVRPPQPESSVELYRDPRVWSIGQFAVLPRFKGLGIGKRLHDAAIQYALRSGGHTMALDTAEPASALIVKYRGWGYSVVGLCDWRPQTNYLSVLMARPLLLSDELRT